MYIISGTAETGILALAAEMRQVANSPCGKEAVFSPTGKPAWSTKLPGDASWLAAPHIDAQVAQGHRVLHLLRDPLVVVDQLMQRGFLNRRNNQYDRYVAKHLPSLEGAPDHLGRVIRYVVEWDLPLQEAKVPRFQLDLPPIDQDRLLAVLGYLRGDEVTDSSAADPVVRLRDAMAVSKLKLGWADIDKHPDGAALRERAEQFGYLETEQEPNSAAEESESSDEPSDQDFEVEIEDQASTDPET